MTNIKRKILFTTYILLGIVIFFAFMLRKSIWVADSIVLGFLLFIIYLARKQLNLTDFLFLLLSSLVLMHCFAVFGLFKIKIFGNEYDTYIHFYAGVVLVLVSFNYAMKFKISIVETVLLTLFIALGIGLFNEIIEFLGYRLFGEGGRFVSIGPWRCWRNKRF
ncbi:hypothetical protein ACFL58_01390 [Elusimicrobiota bacterium]